MSTISPEDGGAEAVGELSKKSGGIDVVTEARGPNPRDETDARNEKGIPKVKSLQAINRCPSDKLAGTKSTGVSRGVVINVQPSDSEERAPMSAAKKVARNKMASMPGIHDVDDDDASPAPKWLQEAVEAHNKRYAGSSAVEAGEVGPAPPAPITQRQRGMSRFADSSSVAGGALNSGRTDEHVLRSPRASTGAQMPHSRMRKNPSLSRLGATSSKPAIRVGGGSDVSSMRPLIVNGTGGGENSTQSAHRTSDGARRVTILDGPPVEEGRRQEPLARRRRSTWCCFGGGGGGSAGDEGSVEKENRHLSAVSKTGRERSTGRLRSTTGAVAASVGARVAALVKRFEEQRVGPLVHRLEGDMESIDNEEALRDLSDIGRQVAERYLGKDTKQRKIRQQAEQWMEKHAAMIANM